MDKKFTIDTPEYNEAQEEFYIFNVIGLMNKEDGENNG